MHRLFVALRPPRAVRDLLRPVQDGVRGARWQDDDQLHLTLRFVGEVDRPVAEDLAAAIAGLRAPAPAVAVAGVGTFEARGRSGTLWAGLTPRDPLAALHRKVDQACIRAGLEPERRAFLPHVTLARLSRGVGDPAEIAAWHHRHAGLTGPPAPWDRLILYESRLGHEGASYEPRVLVHLD